MTTKSNSSAADTSDREIVISRVFDAPRSLVWEAMTNPRHVVNWWGPNGFTDTIETMDFRVGGAWKHVMRGPDGTEYPNKSIFKEIVPLERIVFSHGGGKKDGKGGHFTATWSFDEPEAGKTKITARMVFATPEERDFIAKEYGAVEGGKQTLGRLAGYLPTMASSSPDFVLSREFDAPRSLVWNAWTQAEHLQRWFGPKGFVMPTCSLDLRPGGVFLYGMKSPDGHEMWGKWIFREIAPPGKLVVIASFSDAKGGVTRHPMSPTWPLETLSTMTLTEKNGKTTLNLRWSAYNATPEERKTFDSSHDSMRQGWGGTMEQFAAYLAEAQKK